MITEYVYAGLSNQSIDWELQEDGQALHVAYGAPVTPTRFRLSLRHKLTGAVVTVDTSTGQGDIDATLSAGGHFEWDDTTSIVYIRLGSFVPASLPLGTYEPDLNWYDATNPNGVRWGEQSVEFVIAN